MTCTRLAIGLTGLVLVAGCNQHTDKRVPANSATPAAGQFSPQDLPPAISASFRQDHPTAGITNITQLSAETGAPLYRVTYIENRVPGSATYFYDGRQMTSSEQQKQQAEVERQRQNTPALSRPPQQQ